MLKRQKLEEGKKEYTPTPDEDGMVAVTIKVKEAGYVPDGVEVRSRIDDYFFTANIEACHFNNLNDDPLVESFAAASQQRMIR